MADLYDALSDLVDALDTLSGQLGSDGRAGWVNRLVLLIGSVQQDLGGNSGHPGAARRARDYADRVSHVDPASSGTLDRLLRDIDDFVASL